MNENVRKVFDILGIEPDIRVKIDSGHRVDEFMFDEELNQYHYVTDVCGNEIRWCVDGVIANILTGEFKIIKQPKFTDIEQKAIELCKMLGYKYIAKDFNGDVWAHKSKPYKCVDDFWECEDNDGSNFELPSQLEFNSLSWSDEEPYYIGD